MRRSRLRQGGDVNPLTRLSAQATLPLALLISMTHLVEADQGPGDGFTAGIISSLGITLQYVAFGYEAASRRFWWVGFERLLALGLAIALSASVLPILTGGALLGPREAELDLPLVGVVRLTRAMLFDLGIYLVVLGGTMTAIESLERARRPGGRAASPRSDAP